MLSVYLSFVLSLSRVPGSVSEDPSSYLCDTTVDGSTCSSSGAAIYISQGDPPARPSTFWPISHTQWTFTADGILIFLGVSTYDVYNISGKFSGVFIAPSTGLFLFLLEAQHSIIDNVCYFDSYESAAFIDADVAYSGEGENYGMKCSSTTSTSCANYPDSTDYWYCERQFYFVAGNKYPFFAGLRYNWTVPQTSNLWMRLRYQDPSGSISRIAQKQSIVGLTKYTAYESSTSVSDSSESNSSSPSASSVSASSSPTPSVEYTIDTDDELDDNSSLVVVGSKKANGVIIGGVCAGAFVIAAIGAVAIWFVLSKVKRRRRRAGSSAVGRRKGSSGSGRRRSGIATKLPDGLKRRSSKGSQPDTRVGDFISNRSGGSYMSHSGGSHKSRSVSSYMSRSGGSHMSHSGGSHKKRSGSSHMSHSGGSHKKRSGSSHRSHSGSGRKKRSGSSHRSHSGSGHKKRSGSSHKSHSGSGRKKRSGSSHRSHSGSGHKKRSGGGIRNVQEVANKSRQGADRSGRENNGHKGPAVKRPMGPVGN